MRSPFTTDALETMLPLPIPEHVPERHLQLLQHRLKTTQSDGLVTLLQTEKSGRCEPCDFRELSKRHLATGLLQEFGKLLVEI